MGLDLASLQLLCCAKNMAVDFSQTLMIGRQTLFCEQREVRDLLSQAGINSADHVSFQIGDFGEPIFECFGAKQVSSLDASDYEHPTYVGDLNFPCPHHLLNQFSLVYDGGSLEHVFNIPQAFKTCMEMVRVGGHFVQVTAANNFMGHGFWQVSPETAYRMFTPENGYSINVVVLREVQKDGWYLVSDPDKFGARVELLNDRRTYICTIAQRIADKHIFTSYPSQSDYARLWKTPKTEHQKWSQPVPSIFRQMIPKPLKKVIRFALNSVTKAPSPFNRPCYRYISSTDFIRARLDEESS